MISMLASVTNVAEAHMAMQSGVEIIDLKNPAQGALGALPKDMMAAIVREVSGHQKTGHHQVSATMGDLPMQPDVVLPQAEAVAAAGVDIVKMGFFGREGHDVCIRAVEPLARQHKMVAVLFADESPDLALLPKLASAGFHGVMLDTARKDGRRLLDHLAVVELQTFIVRAQALHLMTGLAGSLRAEDIPLLAPLDPDYLGFRGAICVESNRINALSAVRMERILGVLHEYNSALV